MFKIFIILNFFFCASVFSYELFRAGFNVTSPRFLSVCFMLINSTVGLYFLFEPDFISVYFSSGSISYSVFFEVFGIYFFVSFMTYFFLLIFDRLRLSRKSISAWYFNKLSNADVYFSLKLTLFFYVLSLTSLFFYVGTVGGYVNLWQNLGSRQDIFAGSGFALRVVVLLVQFFGVSVFLNLIFKSKFLAFLFVFITSFVLLSLGGRLLIFEFLFYLFVSYYLFVGRFNIKFRNIFLFSIFVVASVFVGELRKPSTLEDLKSSPSDYIVDFSSGFIRALMPYTLPVQRDVVIVEYFSEREFWYGASYSSVLYGFFPSVIMPAKPPVDTGRYIVAMANGQEVNPPVPVYELPNYGWPESFMAGYVNFGILGVILIVFVSCFVVVYFYKWLLYRPSVVLVMLYCSLIVRGVKYMDPLNIISFVIFIIVLTMLAFLLYFLKRVRIYV